MTHGERRSLPCEQPLVDVGEGQHLEQQPDGHGEKQQREALDEEVQPDVEQSIRQLLKQRESVNIHT